MAHDPADGVKDMGLAEEGREQIALAEANMGALVELGERFAAERPFAGRRLAVNLHVTKETAVLVRVLKKGGAERIALMGCNAFSTQDAVAAALADEGIEVFAKHGRDTAQYYRDIERVLEVRPHVIVDDGCDLVVGIHEKGGEYVEGVIGSCEQTTSGVIRARNMTASGALRFPLVATNENKTKHLLDNYYGTGQSVWDGIMRSTAMFCAAKTAVCIGYGACGKGIALRAKGLGAQVVVCEVHPFRALQALYDGHQVMPMAEAAARGDVFCSATGSKHVVSAEHIRKMKSGAMICNAGQFDYEIDLKGLRAMQARPTPALRRRRMPPPPRPPPAARAQVGESRFPRPHMEEVRLDSGKHVYLLGGGNLVNLSCAEGHPSEVMATSFLGQALACEYIVKSAAALPPGITNLPEEIDDRIAALQLGALGVSIDALTAEQEAYAKSWREGTCD